MIVHFPPAVCLVFISQISKLLHYGSRRGQSWVYSAVGPNQVWLWDVEGSSCKQLFRTLPSNEHVPLPSLAVEEETVLPSFFFCVCVCVCVYVCVRTGVCTHPPTILCCITPLHSALITRRLSQLGLPSTVLPSAGDTKLFESALLSPSIRALHSPQDCPFLLTGGSDRHIRYWDLADVAHSYVLSGLETDQLRPRYRSHAHEGATVFEELPSSDTNETLMQLRRTTRGRTRGPVSVNHNDCILDIKTLQAPSRMLISASRDGIVKVFQ
jgi:WD40 repeat protein